jgi:hypothetical protein
MCVSRILFKGELVRRLQPATLSAPPVTWLPFAALMLGAAAALCRGTKCTSSRPDRSPSAIWTPRSSWARVYAQPPPAAATLHPAPCTLHPAPCTLHPAPCTLHSPVSSLQSPVHSSPQSTVHSPQSTVLPAQRRSCQLRLNCSARRFAQRFFGESAMMDSTPRNADVFAQTKG